MEGMKNTSMHLDLEDSHYADSNEEKAIRGRGPGTPRKLSVQVGLMAAVAEW